MTTPHSTPRWPVDRIADLWCAVRTRLAPAGRLGRTAPRLRRLAPWLALAAAGGLVVPGWLGTVSRLAPHGDRFAVSGRGGVLRSDPEVARRAIDGGVAPRQAAYSAPATVPGDPAAVPWGRRILRRATLTVELADVDRGIARLTNLVEATGGYVAETQTWSDDAGTLRATVTAYVPPAEFGRTLRDLDGLGRATSRQISGQDVSEEFVDLEARVRNLERHEGQLLAFMGKAQKLVDLLSIEQELARVRGEIERLSGRIRFLSARTEMAAVQVSLTRTVAPVVDSALARAWERVRQAFVEGWFGAFHLAVGLAAFAAQMSPLGLLALAAWGLYRRSRRQPVAAPPTVTT
ncbi:MAG: DUF4349 domain-containing protein [Candidatus Rokubacteria bacterium]|nr:DUF4349 domain-containing protein [Candidatus Rokubacteria bacterium]